MKNITLSVEEEVLKAVRRVASSHQTSVNALVREYLTTLAAQEDAAATARKRMLQLSAGSEGRLGKQTWQRADLHDR